MPEGESPDPWLLLDPLPFISPAGDPVSMADDLGDLAEYAAFCAQQPDVPVGAYEKIRDDLRAAQGALRSLAALELDEGERAA
jgi:hypothetical protein